MALENVHSSIVNCSFLFDREMLEQSSGELDKTIADLEEKSNNVEDEGTNYYKHNYPKLTWQCHRLKHLIHSGRDFLGYLMSYLNKNDDIIWFVGRFNLFPF